MNKPKKVALAYSGGLDTSIIIPWLKENYGCEVVAIAVDVGQAEETSGLAPKAYNTGACDFYLVDAKEEFAAEHRAQAGRDRARDGLRRARARLHRQGQRSGAVRARVPGARAGAEGHRAV